jgi:hypothetical protein
MFQHWILGRTAFRADVDGDVPRRVPAPRRGSLLEQPQGLYLSSLDFDSACSCHILSRLPPAAFAFRCCFWLRSCWHADASDCCAQLAAEQFTYDEVHTVSWLCVPLPPLLCCPQLVLCRSVLAAWSSPHSLSLPSDNSCLAPSSDACPQILDTCT